MKIGLHLVAANWNIFSPPNCSCLCVLLSLLLDLHNVCNHNKVVSTFYLWLLPTTAFSSYYYWIPCYMRIILALNNCVSINCVLLLDNKTAGLTSKCTCTKICNRLSNPSLKSNGLDIFCFSILLSSMQQALCMHTHITKQ